MTRLVGARTRHQTGLTGGLFEDSDPDLVARSDGDSALSLAKNFIHGEGGRLQVRGGSTVQLSFEENAISSVLGLWPFSPTGAILIAHSETNQKHYAYALTDTAEFALPVNAPTETGSVVELGWATAAPHRPVAVELFERMYVTDALESNRESLVVLAIVAGELTATIPDDYDLDGNSTPGEIKPYGAAVYNGHLFIWGTDSEGAVTAPHMLRHSFLGIEPGQANGFDKDAYAIIGAQGQWLRAGEPGNSILLMAKDNELYRISGSGAAVAGWQFSIQPVANTRGFGCSNPNALTHVNGWWYGVGQAGPFRTDGQSIQDLGAPRWPSWLKVDHLEVAQVAFDPDRSAVLFGFHLVGEPDLPIAPYVLWQFDTAREVWGPDLRYKSGRAFAMVRAIPRSSGSGPSTVPTLLAQSTAYGNMAFETVSGIFAAGDPTASTEVWVRGETGASTLSTTLAPGVQRFTIPRPAASKCFVRVRHSKEGVYTDFSEEIAMYTRLLAPDLTIGPRALLGTMQADLYHYSDGADLVFESWDGTPSNSYPARATGALSIYGLSNEACIVPAPSDCAQDWLAYCQRVEWPIGFQVSDITHCFSWGLFCNPSSGVLSPPRPTQVLERGFMATDRVTIRFRGMYYPLAYRVQYRLLGSSPWLDWTDVYAGPDFPSFDVTITGLAASARYEVRLLNPQVASASAAITCYTLLEPPTMTVASNGSPGTPTLDFTVSAPYDDAEVQLYDERETTAEVLTDIDTTPSVVTRSYGVCGQPGTWYARVRNTLWPEPFQFSEAVSDTVDDPCTVGT